MTLSEEALERLADVVALQPTKNAELQDRWGMEEGSEVHSYLESELKEDYYRNEDSLICATPEAGTLVREEGLLETSEDGEELVQVPPIQAAIIDVIAPEDAEPQSVVAVLHSLVDKGIVERIRKTVPTFRLAVEREAVDVEVREE